MTRQLVWIFSVVIAVASVRSAWADDDVTELVKRADMAYRGTTSAGVFEMEVKTSSYQRSYTIVLWSEDRGDNNRALVKILGPALWRGFGTLKNNNQLKLYDPKTNHVTVVSHSMLGNSWMGSHFTNDDLVKETQLAKHYEASLLKKWQSSSALGDQTTFYQVKLQPRPSAPVAWDHIDYTLAEKGRDIIPVEAAYYRKQSDQEPTRTIRFSNLSMLAGKQLPATLEIEVRGKPGEYTRITYKQLELGVMIPESKFGEQALRK